MLGRFLDKKFSTIVSLFLWSGVFLSWRIFYVYHLMHREQVQIFQMDLDYLFEHLSMQGGFSVYLGEFFVQFFKLPLLGPLIIASLLLLSYLLFKRLLVVIIPMHVSLFLALIPSLLYGLLLVDGFYYI